MFRRAILVITSSILVAGCGVRTPAQVDVVAMVRTQGEENARIALQSRVLAHPRDVAARLALAELSERAGRPTEAIEQLVTVEHLGGPLGIRWHASDRERLGRLLLARGRVRLARGASSALADLEHAGHLGIAATRAELANARLAVAFALLRQVDGDLRAKGRAMLAREAASSSLATNASWPGTNASSPATNTSSPAATTSAGNEAWAGAREGASPTQRGVFGAWLWRIQARRESYEQLVAWHDATKPPRDERLQAAYLRAVAWWSPLWLGDVSPPPAEDLVGPERCWFPGAACEPPAVDDEPLPPVAIGARPTWDVAVAHYAATRVLAAYPTGDAAHGNDGHGTSTTTNGGTPPTTNGATSTTTNGADRGDDKLEAALVRIVDAYRRDPAIADRLARDLVAESVDDAAGHATVGALFDALGDPGRARAAWQAAADASAEPALLRGLAEAAAHAGDGPGAIVFATTAAAASGDPAVVWAALAAALLEANRPVDALEASRSALDLAGPEVLPGAIDTAVAASRAMGRTQQADALLVQRAQIAPRTKTDDTELKAALGAHRERSTASTVARLWVASRGVPRDVESRAVLLDELELDDARRPVIAAELLVLAGDPDAARGRAAANALRDRTSR